MESTAYSEFLFFILAMNDRSGYCKRTALNLDWNDRSMIKNLIFRFSVQLSGAS